MPVTTPLTLAEAAAAVPGAVLVGSGGLVFREIVFDSRQVAPGDLFVAIPRVSADGDRYVSDALRRGAAGVVADRREDLLSNTPGLLVPSTRIALAMLSAWQFGWPGRQLRVIGITGTDGKTTTTNLLASILRAAGRRVGVVTTVHAEVGNERIDTGLHTTTPDAPDLQRYMRQMVDAGAQDAVLEVTSHGLAQHRVDGCEFDVAVVTNVTRDHLDFHQTEAGYLAAKLRLFESLATAARKPGVAKGIVYNLDDRSAEPISRLWSERRLSYALEQKGDVRARAVQRGEGWTQFDVIAPEASFPVELPLLGWYNVANALAATAAALLLDVPVAAIQEGLARFAGISGRLERIDRGQAFAVYVDFAHTPNSLESVLTLVREDCRRRLFVVFGCAGLRDRTKRPLMGAIAGRLADRIYLTAEDPRTEDVDRIIDEIVVGCQSVGRQEEVDYLRIPDRGQAIARALADAQPGDVVVVAGKGHERTMCFGQTEVPWSDQEAVRQLLEEGFLSERNN